MSITTGASPVVAELLHALGLDDLGRVAAVNIDIKPEEPVKMVVGFYVLQEEIDKAIMVVKERGLYMAQKDGSPFCESEVDRDAEIHDIAKRLLDSAIKKTPVKGVEAA